VAAPTALPRPGSTKGSEPGRTRRGRTSPAGEPARLMSNTELQKERE
jgi:hypothetical protein